MLHKKYINFKMNQSLKRGFTLIELLVVIAIIGILASVVLASLNTARDKGADAAVKGAMAQVRTQAELFYDIGRTYDVMCSSAGIVKITANAAANSVASASVVNADATAGTATTVICHDSLAAYAVAAPLKGTAGSYFCVDSAGAAKVTATALVGGSYTCP